MARALPSRKRSEHRSQSPRCTGRRTPVALGLLMLCASLAQADPQPPPAAQHPVEHSGIDTVTIEARRRKQVAQEVDHFVNSVTGHPRGESVPRWNARVCPLVAGLPRPQHGALDA
jgi:hypothetical protein